MVSVEIARKLRKLRSIFAEMREQSWREEDVMPKLKVLRYR